MTSTTIRDRKHRAGLVSLPKGWVRIEDMRKLAQPITDAIKAAAEEVARIERGEDK